MGPLIVKYITLFPLFLPVWQDRPLTDADLRPGPYPVVVTAEQIALQREAFGEADRELRMLIARELRQTQEQSAFLILLGRLGAEKDPEVLANVVQQVDMSPFRPAGLAAVVTPLLEHSDQAVRYWTTDLYGRCDGADPARLVKALSQDPSQAVRQVAAERLRDLPGAVTAELWGSSGQAPDACVAAAITVGFCLGPAAPGAANELARQLPLSHEAVRFAVAARLGDLPPSLQQALIPIVAQDPAPSVRGEAVAVLGRLARPTDPPRVLALTRDVDPEVRRRAVASCAAYPGPETLVALIDRLQDERTLVRREAEEVAVAMDRECPAGAAVAARLSAARFPGRGHLCRVLGRVGYTASAAAVHATLAGETEPEGIRDAVFALGMLGYRPAAGEIAALGTHISPVVRAGVGEALGRLAVPATYGTVRTLAFDPEETVRQATILGIGVTADGTAFSETVRQVLLLTRPEKMSSANRAAAAWTAGRLRPIAPELVKRLKVQATEPVVPGPMGEPLFEEDAVLANVDFALAALAQEDPFARTTFAEVCSVHRPSPSAGSQVSGSTAYVATSEVAECALQAQEYAAGTPVTPRPRPTTTMSFRVEPLQKTSE